MSTTTTTQVTFMAFFRDSSQLLSNYICMSEIILSSYKCQFCITHLLDNDCEKEFMTFHIITHKTNYNMTNSKMYPWHNTSEF